MKLREIRIQNFKSIQAAAIENIENIDVLCGKNNSGKSSIFEALNLLRGTSIYPEIRQANLSNQLFTLRDNQRILNITLTFDVEDEERLISIEKYCMSPANQPDRRKPDIKKELLDSPFFRKISYEFESYPGTTDICLNRVRVLSTDKMFSTIVERNVKTPQEGLRFKIVSISHLLKDGQPLSHEIMKAYLGGEIGNRTDGLTFDDSPFRLFSSFIEKVYLFSIFRSSQRTLPANEAREMEPNGNNLVQRIFTIKNNEPKNWKDLQRFVELVLPNQGELESRVVGNNTETRFFDERLNIGIDIHDMGSGIEQLLMIACVMISRMKGSLILIESPEHHLHPGAQRALLHFIRSNLRGNQVLIATHSPVFLSQRDLGVHIVKLTKNWTEVKKADDLEDLSMALNALGSKNSDVLLADSVLFVEGNSDEKIIKAWARNLGIDFDSKNILCVKIGGGRNLNYYAKTDLLKKISLKSPVPYFFIIDRDEKSETTIKRIQDTVEKVCLLQCREIENCLLIPKYILETMRLKAKGDSQKSKLLDVVQVGEIEKNIAAAVDDMKDIIILKRLKEELGGGSFIPDEALEELIAKTKGLPLEKKTDIIYEAIDQNLDSKLGKSNIKNLFERQALIVESIWARGDEKEKKKTVPGEDVLTIVFQNFGLKYSKSKDGERIALQMKEDEIPGEVKSVIEELAERKPEP